MERTDRNRVLIFIQGVLLLILGFYSLAHPGALILTMALFFRWFLLITGIFNLITGLSHNEEKELRTSHILGGIVLIVLALIFMFSSYLSEAVLIYTLVGWFIYSSIASIALSFSYKTGALKFISIIFNVIVIIIAIQALFNPALAGGIFVITLAFNFILLGINEILLIFMSRK